MSTGRPSDLAVLTALYLDGQPWSFADEVAAVLHRQGFELTSQQLATTLGRLCREDLPAVEFNSAFSKRRYRLTRHGLTQLRNTWPGSHPLRTAA